MPENNKPIKTYGELIFDDQKNMFVITRADPHVCIKLKHVFQKLAQNSVAPFHFSNTAEICADLQWFLHRYPLLNPAEQYSDESRIKLLAQQYLSKKEKELTLF